VILFECQKELCYSRIKNRRIDPKTGKIVEIGGTEDNDEEQFERLVQMKEDEKEVFEKKTEAWADIIPDIEQAYGAQLMNVSTDQPEDEVTNVVTDLITSANYS